MNSKLKNIVKQAVQKFYENDIELVQVKGMEQACVFRIGLYLNEIMKNYPELNHLQLDCEYNKSNRGTKMLAGVKIRPDLIIHKRNLNNNHANQYNTLVIEFKGWWNNNISDIEKLKNFTSPQYGYHYPLAIFIKLGKNHNKTIYRYFQNGNEISENDIL